MKTFISTSNFAEYCSDPLELLRKKKIDFTLNPYKRKLSEEEVTEILSSGEYAGLIAGIESLSGKVLEGACGLKVISRVGVGLDNVDLKAAKKLRIKVFNTPDVLTDSVAELTLGLMLCCLRKIGLMDRNIRKEIWKKEMGSLLKGKIVGLVGFGHIGQRVARLVTAFGAKIIFTDVRKIKKTGARQVEFANLIKSADIISLHCSGNELLISDKEIEKAKQGVIIINTARGSLVDEGGLLKGLSSRKIACVGLDVFEEEPYKGELFKQDNVILTPHIGSYAKEARIVMERLAVKNLIKGLKC